MVKTIRVSEEFHELVAAHKRSGETMEEALRRMVGGPSPKMLEAALAGGDEFVELLGDADGLHHVIYLDIFA